ncbi:MAG: ABC transporter substrate-binding protein [Candidatus Woesearchaeota archaeon]
MKNKTIISVLVLFFVLTLTFTISAQENINLSMWTFVEAHADYYQTKVEEFNEQSDKYNINLQTEVYPYQEMHDQLQIAFQTGVEVPDLVDIEIRYFSNYTSMDEDDIPLIEISDLIDNHKEHIIEERLSPYSKGDQIYGVPTHLGAMVMYYNKDLLDEAGYSADDIETWEDFREIGKEVTKDTDDDGENDQYMLVLQTADRFDFHAVTRQFGSNVFDKDGNVVIDREENVKAWEMMQDFIFEDEIAATAPGGDIESSSFYEDMSNGKFAAVMAPQWYTIRMTEFMPDLEGKIQIRPLPRHEDGGTRSGMGGGTGTAITEYTDESKVEAAKEFLDFAKLTYDANVSIWRDFGFDPFRTDVYEDEELYEPLPYFDDEVVMETILELVENEEIQPLYVTDQFTRADDLIEEFLLPATLTDGEDVRTSLEDLAERLKSE